MTSRRSAILAVAGSLTGIRNGLRAAEQPVAKIGVQIPLFGERASVGRLMLNGLQMALDSINSAAGEQGQKFALVLSDDESTPEGAVKSLDKFVSDPQILAIAGEINSPFVLASAPVIDKEGIPYLTAGSSPRTTAQSKWIFRVGASDAFLVDAMARYAAEDLKVKSIAILHDKTGIHNQRADLLAGVLKERYGIEPVVTVSWSPGDRQFTAQFDGVKASSAQAIVAFGETPDGGVFFRQLKASGIQLPVIGQRDFGIKRVLDEAAGGAEGTVIFTEYSPELQGGRTLAWNAEYKKLYLNDANVIAAQYYDAFFLLAAAMRTGGATRAGVKAGLERAEVFPGMVADYSFDASRNGVHRLLVARVVSGKLSLVRTVTDSSK